MGVFLVMIPTLIFVTYCICHIVLDVKLLRTKPIKAICTKVVEHVDYSSIVTARFVINGKEEKIYIYTRWDYLVEGETYKFYKDRVVTRYILDSALMFRIKFCIVLTLIGIVTSLLTVHYYYGGFDFSEFYISKLCVISGVSSIALLIIALLSFLYAKKHKKPNKYISRDNCIIGKCITSGYRDVGHLDIGRVRSNLRTLPYYATVQYYMNGELREDTLRVPAFSVMSGDDVILTVDKFEFVKVKGNANNYHPIAMVIAILLGLLAAGLLCVSYFSLITGV